MVKTSSLEKMLEKPLLVPYGAAMCLSLSNHRESFFPTIFALFLTVLVAEKSQFSSSGSYYISNFKKHLHWVSMMVNFFNFCITQKAPRESFLHRSLIKLTVFKNITLSRKDIITKDPYFFRYFREVSKESMIFTFKRSSYRGTGFLYPELIIIWCGVLNILNTEILVCSDRICSPTLSLNKMPHLTFIATVFSWHNGVINFPQVSSAN